MFYWRSRNTMRWNIILVKKRWPNTWTSPILSTILNVFKSTTLVRKRWQGSLTVWLLHLSSFKTMRYNFSFIFQLHIPLRRRVLPTPQPLPQRVQPSVPERRHLQGPSWCERGPSFIRLRLPSGIQRLPLRDPGAGCVWFSSLPQRGHVQAYLAPFVRVWLPTWLYW